MLYNDSEINSCSEFIITGFYHILIQVEAVFNDHFSFLKLRLMQKSKNQVDKILEVYL